MRTPFKSSRTMLATAMTSAALIGAGSVAAVTAFVDSDPATAPQVTVSGDAQPTADSSSSVAAIYKSSHEAVVEIAVTSRAAAAARHAAGAGLRLRLRRAGPCDHEPARRRRRRVGRGDLLRTARPYDATVVGSDPSTDIAVLDVDAPASVLEPLELADSSQLEVGDGVVAIGSPFGLEQTVTTGIVSALHRQITAPNNFAIDDAIQTDAAINHGNSGGPLLDLNGNVVGVNSQIESESGGNDGVGFAVPSNTVRANRRRADRRRLGRARLSRRRDRGRRRIDGSGHRRGPPRHAGRGGRTAER